MIKLKRNRLLAVCLSVLMLVAGWGVTPVQADTGDKNPVIFVHGYSDVKSDLFGKSNFGPLIDYLVSQGWSRDRLYSIQYSDTFGSNVTNADELDAFIEDVLAATESQKVDLVAHSMGGLSTRYYIKNLGGADKVESLITLGSPHQGTPLAYMVGLTGGGQEMIPDSDFLLALNDGDLTPGSVQYTSIYTYTDELVPNWSSQLSGWNNIGGWYNMHLTMLLHSSVHTLVKNNLSQ